MGAFSRRDFTKRIGTLALANVADGASAPFAIAQRPAKVVIVGGGAGGATLAHYLKKGGPLLDVTLIEPNPIYSSAFFSNLYLGGLRTLESLNHTYGGLQRLGVKVVTDQGSDVDATAKVVKTKGGRSYKYDRLVLSPGIEIKYDAIKGYSREAARIMPHAYTTSAHNKRLLKRQLQTMRDGGTVVIAAPDGPSRCPPSTYERACMIAHFLKSRKPRSKLVIVDAKKNLREQQLITEAFDKYYKGIVELHMSTETDDFSILRVDARNKEILTRAGKRLKADVANVIPPQRAGDIAAKAGCTDGDWCPINPESFASKVKDVYVLGDAASAADMPKSAAAANSQAKLVAAQILSELTKKEKPTVQFSSACWSLLAPDDCVKIGADYVARSGRLEAMASYISQPGESDEVRRQNYQESLGWYAAITADMFGRQTPH